MDSYGIKIVNVHIKNFRGINDLKIDNFDERTCTLVGPNASGKTSFIEALNIALSDNSSKFNNITEADFHSEEPIEITVKFNKYYFLVDVDGNGYKRLLPCKGFTKVIKKRDRKAPNSFFSPEYQISIKHHFEEYERLSDKDIKEKFSEILTILPDRWIPAYEVEIQENGDIQYGYKTSGTSGLISERHIYSLEKYLFPQIFYFDKDRDRELLLGYNTTFKKIFSELNWRYKKQFISSTTIKEELIETHANLHSSILENTEYIDEIFKPVSELLTSELKIDFDLADLNIFVVDLFSPYENAFLGVKTDTNKIVRLNKFGSGITILYSCALLISLATRADTPIIICIDEPELHLHAKLQKKLYELFCIANYQTILATHSHLFVNKATCGSNFSCKRTSKGNMEMEKCSQLELANNLFGLLGNSLDDLYLPEDLVLVEGKFDKQIIIKAGELLGYGNQKKQIMHCGGDTEVRKSGEGLQKFFDTYLDTSQWYSRFIKATFKFIVDGDVADTKFNAWKSKFGLDDTRAKKLATNGIEYLFPEYLVKELVKDCVLKDGSQFIDLTKEEIVQIILAEEDMRNNEEQWGSMQQEYTQAVSKFRLNQYVYENITKEILESMVGAELKALVDWVFVETE